MSRLRDCRVSWVSRGHHFLKSRKVLVRGLSCALPDIGCRLFPRSLIWVTCCLSYCIWVSCAWRVAAACFRDLENAIRPLVWFLWSFVSSYVTSRLDVSRRLEFSCSELGLALSTLDECSWRVLASVSTLCEGAF